MPWRLLTAVAFLVSFSASAATTTWEAYDFRTCTHWRVTPNDFGPTGPAYAGAAALAERANGGIPEGGWIVVEAQALWKAAEPGYGVCRFADDSVLSCMPGAGFPLAGAAYTKVSQAGAEDVYICSRDCDRTGVGMILDTAYEEATVFSKRALRTIRHFESSCHEEAQQARFSRSELRRQKRESATQKKSAGSKQGG